MNKTTKYQCTKLTILSDSLNRILRYLFWTLLVMLLLPQRSCSYNYTMRCFVVNNSSEVTWNITFNDQHHPNLQSSEIQIQTRGEFEKGWNNLRRCKRDHNSIQCEIERDLTRLRFVLRLVNTTSSVSLTSQSDQDESRFQNGFNCFKNHDRKKAFVHDFSVSNISSNSADISWSFYTWDIDRFILLWFRYYICTGANCTYEDNTPFTDSGQIYAVPDTPLFYSESISGLDPCTSYRVQLIGSYINQLPHHIVESSFRTTCTSGMVIYPWVNILIVIVCLVLLSTITIILFLFFLTKSFRRRQNLTQNISLSVVDLELITVDPTLRTTLERVESFDLIYPRVMTSERIYLRFATYEDI